MQQSYDNTTQRYDQAESLITLARGLLNRPAEEMVVLYLDHALETLHMITEKAISTTECPSRKF